MFRLFLFYLKKSRTDFKLLYIIICKHTKPRNEKKSFNYNTKRTKVIHI